jgi:hypothetical protein
MGLLFLSGMPLMVFVAPREWWPWSLLIWFVGFIVLERTIDVLLRKFTGKGLPGGEYDMSISSGGTDGGGDGGGGGD